MFIMVSACVHLWRVFFLFRGCLCFSSTRVLDGEERERESMAISAHAVEQKQSKIRHRWPLLSCCCCNHAIFNHVDDTHGGGTAGHHAQQRTSYATPTAAALLRELIAIYTHLSFVPQHLPTGTRWHTLPLNMNYLLPLLTAITAVAEHLPPILASTIYHKCRSRPTASMVALVPLFIYYNSWRAVAKHHRDTLE